MNRYAFNTKIPMKLYPGKRVKLKDAIYVLKDTFFVSELEEYLGKVRWQFEGGAWEYERDIQRIYEEVNE